MNSLIFPDINVWLAILLEDHVHRKIAQAWWEREDLSRLNFVRLTQVGVLRLLTTSAAMNDRPLTMAEAWAAYDRLFTDDRVAFFPEPLGMEACFRRYTSEAHASPKLWADAWLLACAELSGGVIVTFDRALARRRNPSLLLKP